jgi:hypothetical protein
LTKHIAVLAVSSSRDALAIPVEQNMHDDDPPVRISILMPSMASQYKTVEV